MFFRLPYFFLLPAVAWSFTLMTSNLKGWDRDEVHLRLNPEDCPVSVVTLEGAIDRATDLWDRVPTAQIKLVYDGLTDQHGSAVDPIVECDPAGSTGIYASGIIATTGGVIRDAHVVLNAQAGSSSNIGNLDDERLAFVLAHELGHVLGLGHAPSEDALMYYALGDRSRLSLSADDIDGLTYLYPRHEPFDGALGCGTLGGAGGAGGGLFPWLALAGLITFLLRLPSLRKPRTAFA